MIKLSLSQGTAAPPTRKNISATVEYIDKFTPRNVFFNVKNESKYCQTKALLISYLQFHWGKGETNNTPPKFNSSPLKNGGWKTFAFPIGIR